MKNVKIALSIMLSALMACLLAVGAVPFRSEAHDHAYTVYTKDYVYAYQDSCDKNVSSCSVTVKVYHVCYRCSCGSMVYVVEEERFHSYPSHN